MQRQRFGELLGRFVQLSPHDISEILEDQFASRRRFGEIALAFGLCKPQHVWRAWWAQLPDEPARVDLEVVGIDVQALTHVPRKIASELGIIPVRALGGEMVVAASDGALSRAAQTLQRLLQMQLKFVLADARQIRSAIDKHYPTGP